MSTLGDEYPREQARIREQAERLWEDIGGGLCICARADVVHWCESCQRKITVISAALSPAPDLRGLENLAREIGTVAGVARRRSDPDAETRQMIARLDDWRARIFAVLAPPTNTPREEA